MRSVVANIPGRAAPDWDFSMFNEVHGGEVASFIRSSAKKRLHLRIAMGVL